MKRVVRGSCLCGGVRFEVTPPFLRASHCHCERCRKHSGTAVCTQARVPKERFRLVSGAKLVRVYGKGEGAVKAFCRNCGSSLFGGDWPDGPEVSIRMGAFDDEPGIRPQFHTYVDDRAPWDAITDNLPQFPARWNQRGVAKSRLTRSEQTLLKSLDGVVTSAPVRKIISPAVKRTRAALRKNKSAVMTWESIPLTSLGCALPRSIKSMWVFVLRAGTDTGAERHPNSHQRMMSWEGAGDLQTGDPRSWTSNVLTSEPGSPLEKRWISVPRNCWHRPVVPAGGDWVVVSFHTVPAEELIEERPDATGSGKKKRMRYLRQPATDQAPARPRKARSSFKVS